MSWSDIKAAWPEYWSDLASQAVTRYRAAIESDPMQYFKQVQGTMQELHLCRVHFARIQALLQSADVHQKDLDNYNALIKRHRTLSAGVYADARPAGEQKMEGPPVLIIGGLIIGVAAIAWSVAAYEYTVNLREQTALMDRELTERVKASESGRSLQPSTVQPKPESSGEGGVKKWLGLMALGGAGIATAFAVAPTLLGRS